MATSTVNISFDKDFLKQIDRLAHEEDRSRSDFLRETVRLYIERKNIWKEIFTFAAKQKKKMALKPDDVAEAIANHRKTSRPSGRTQNEARS